MRCLVNTLRGLCACVSAQLDDAHPCVCLELTGESRVLRCYNDTILVTRSTEEQARLWA